jgi:hypothetical protein
MSLNYWLGSTVLFYMKTDSVILRFSLSSVLLLVSG